MTISLIGRLQVEAELHVLTGLHIGAGKDTLEIGGIDNPVIKHPHTLEPFVPGSSLKGRMRYLLEWAFGTLRNDGHPWGFDEKDPQQKFDRLDPVQRIFGTPAKREKWDGGPTRLICRDAPLDSKWRDKALNSGWSLTEEKTEVVIDRIAGKAHDKVGPRRGRRQRGRAEWFLERRGRSVSIEARLGPSEQPSFNLHTEAGRLIRQLTYN